MYSLRLIDISKFFPTSSGPKQVLNGVSFSVAPGQVACLLGANGSGKTTLLKVMSTLLSPEKGHVMLGDLDAHRQSREAKRLLGFSSSEDHSFYGRLSVKMNLWFYAQLHGMSKGGFQDRLRQLDSELSLSEIFTRPFRELSSGQKQKVLLARALLHNPPILLLDEPHQNLDPAFAIRLRDLLQNTWGKEQKKTILFSTHHLEDALKISDQWVVLSDGGVRFNGSLAEARQARPGFSVESFFQEMTAHAS